MKKVLVFMLAMLMVVSLVGCSSPAESTAQPEENGSTVSEGPVTINLWRHEGTPQESDYYNATVKAFNESQDAVVIEQTVFPDNTYVDQINAAIATNDLPDIIDFDGVYMAGFVNYGALAPLDGYIGDEMKDDLLPSIFDEGTYGDGKVYMLGQFDSGLSFWGNKSHLEAAGVRIPEGVDDAWDKAEFEAALDSLSALDGVEYVLDMKVNYGGGYWVYSYLPVVKSFGGDFIDRETYTAEGIMNGPGSVQAFEYLQWMVEKGYVNATQSSDDDFYGKKVSSLALVGHWMYPTHLESLGEDAVLIPLPDFGNGVYTGSGSYGWGMTTAAVERGVDESAWAVLNYFMSPEAINGIFEANGAVPASKTVLEGIDQYKEGGMLHLYREQLEKGKAYVRPVTPAFATIQDQVGSAAMSILAGADVKEALDEAALEIDTVIEDNGYHGK